MLSIPFLTEPASSHFLPFLFSPTRGVLAKEEWQVDVMPFLLKCFEIRNRALRTKILSMLEYYVADLNESFVMGKVLEEVSLSLHDSDDDLVSYSAAAMVTLANLLARHGKYDDINITIVRPLHHLIVCESSTEALRSHCLLCLMELWNIPKVFWYLLHMQTSSNCIF